MKKRAAVVKETIANISNNYNKPKLNTLRRKTRNYLFSFRLLKKRAILTFTAICITILMIIVTYLYFHHELNVNVHNLHITNESDYARPIGNAATEDYYITRPNGRDDGGTVRVMFVIASNRIDWALCYAVASAYFTNIPIVVAGYRENYPNHVYKLSLFTLGVNKAGLHDNDVVIALDADIMFTGLDFLPFIDKFIKLSPASLIELDAKTIRTGEAMAPSVYSTEKNCFAPQTLTWNAIQCKNRFHDVWKVHKKYEYTLSDDVKPFFNYEDNVIEHINSGVSIHRVWSLRKLFAAFNIFMTVNKPLDNREWWCDQSVFTKLYLELRQWEIEQDYFRKSTKQLQLMTNQYGLHAGMLGLDLIGEMSAMIHPTFSYKEFELTSQWWQRNKYNTEIVINVFSDKKSNFISNLYNQRDVHKLFMERKLTRSYSNVHSVTIAPPLLSIVPRHINGKDKPAERVYPPITHFASDDKFLRENAALNYMQWSLPMMFNEEEWKRGKQYVMSMPIELWSKDDKLRLRYGDVCTKHPFNNSAHAINYITQSKIKTMEEQQQQQK